MAVHALTRHGKRWGVVGNIYMVCRAV